LFKTKIIEGVYNLTEQAKGGLERSNSDKNLGFSAAKA